MTFLQSSHKTIIAFEVSKATLVVHVLPQDRQTRIDNKTHSIRQFLLSHATLQTLVVCEATGGYERAVLAVCSKMGFDIHRAAQHVLLQPIAALPPKPMRSMRECWLNMAGIALPASRPPATGFAPVAKAA